MRKGFTLIELLVVIAIIAVLAAILFPVFARAREKARQSTCSSNQRQIAAAITMYVQDHEETLPKTSTVWSDISVDAGVLVCPTLGKGTPNGYGYYAPDGGKAVGDIGDPVTTPLTCDMAGSGYLTPNIIYIPSDLSARHSNQFIASYADGHVGVNKGENAIDFVCQTPLSMVSGLPAGGVTTDASNLRKAPYWAVLPTFNGAFSNSGQVWYDSTTWSSYCGSVPMMKFACSGGSGYKVAWRDLTSYVPTTTSTPYWWAINMDIIFGYNVSSNPQAFATSDPRAGMKIRVIDAGYVPATTGNPAAPANANVILDLSRLTWNWGSHVYIQASSGGTGTQTLASGSWASSGVAAIPNPYTNYTGYPASNFNLKPVDEVTNTWNHLRIVGYKNTINVKWGPLEANVPAIANWNKPATLEFNPGANDGWQYNGEFIFSKNLSYGVGLP